MELQLLALWKDVLGDVDINVTDNFFHIGGDSLGLIKLLALAHETGVSLTPHLVHEHPTVTELAAALELSTAPPLRSPAASKTNKQRQVRPKSHRVPERKIAADGTKIPLRLSDYEDRPPLFLIPPKGHDVSAFRHLVAEITDYTCYSPYTTENDAVGHRTVEEMAPEYVAQIQNVQATGPYRIAGMCEGSYLAWEMAGLMQGVNNEVEFLGIFDTPNPIALKPVPETFLQRWQRRLRSINAKSIFGFAYQFTKRAVDWARRRLRQTVTRELHLTRRGSRMGWLFRPKPYAGHATLFRAVLDSDAPLFTTDATHGWGDLPERGLDICTIYCDREHLMEPPNAAALAERLQFAIQSQTV